MNAICRACEPFEPCRCVVEDEAFHKGHHTLPPRCPYADVVDKEPKWELDEAPVITMPGGWKVTLREDEYGELLVFVEHREAQKGTCKVVNESDTRGDDGPGWISSYGVIPVEEDTPLFRRYRPGKT